MAEHTPTPWALGSHNLRAVTKDAADIADGCDHYMVAVTSSHSLLGQDEAAANAAFIVKAVNSHDRLTSTIDLLEKNAAIQARLLADTARQRDAMAKALHLARARINYLGVAHTDSKHFEANEATYLPAIDGVLASDVGGSGT